MFADVCKIDVTLPDFYKIDVLKDFAMLKGKHRYQILF